MSKRMHIYAAAIDPLRKKFGVPAKAVAEIVTQTMSRNDKLMAENTAYVAEINALKSAAAVTNAAHDSVHMELTLAQETIADLQTKLAVAAPPTYDFLRFVSPPAAIDSSIDSHLIESAELLETCPAIKDWLDDCLLHNRLGAVYDGGNFVVVCARPLGEEKDVEPLVLGHPDGDAGDEEPAEGQVLYRVNGQATAQAVADMAERVGK